MKKYLPLLLLFLSACKPDEPLSIESEDIKLGGETSVEGSYVKIFQQPAANLNEAQIRQHFQSDIAFGDIFVTAPSELNGGLGPIFNQNSCENCHVGNGRSPFPESGDNLRGLLFRLSVAGAGTHGEPLPVPNFGGQLQPKAIWGVQPEAQVNISFVSSVETYLDGVAVPLQKPVFSFYNAYLPFPSDALFSPRMATPVIGLGLLEAISEADILSWEDENDANQDGISGKANRVWDVRLQQEALGRFGWKAGQPNLYQQTAGAYSGDMGITSPLFPNENCLGQSQCDSLSDDPEITEETLRAATFYAQSLGVPVRRNWEKSEVIEGKKLFRQLQCGSCHRANYTTGTHEYDFLSNQKIYPYTDLLLHDMGQGLADNRPDFRANGQEWRTPPLWGIGLTHTVGGDRAYFLHDGRAKTLEEAILWHGGEAENSKNQFKALDKEKRDAIIAFLKSL